MRGEANVQLVGFPVGSDVLFAIVFRNLSMP
jgi:hypothetical protein